MLVSAFFEHIIPFILVSARLTGLLMFAPMFGHAAVPMRVKAAVVVMFSVVLHFGLGIGFDIGLLNTSTLFLFGIKEFGAGAAMGLVLQIIFAGFGFAAGIIAPQMGMAIAQLIDPQSQQMQPLLSTFFSLIAVLLFLAIDGHLLMIKALHDSYRLVPIAGFEVSAAFTDQLMKIAVEMFVIAIKLAAPVLAVIIFMNAGMAVTARAVPQVNVLVVGFIVTISVGLLLLSLLMPSFAPFFKTVMRDAVEQMLWLMKAV